MFSDKSHKFWKDEKKFDKYSTEYSEKQLKQDQTSTNLNFTYYPTLLGTQRGIFQSSRYHTFLSELAKGSYLKKNGTTETSQCYEGVMTENFTAIDTGLAYSEVFAIKNISRTFLANKGERGLTLNQLAERLLEQPNRWKLPREKRNELQNTITRNVQAVLPNQNSTTKLEISDDHWNPKIIESKNNLNKVNLSVRRCNSIDKHIKNCYDCIKKISEGFDDILQCKKSYAERSLRPKSFVNKKDFDIFDRNINKTSIDSVSVTGHFLNTTHANSGSQNRFLFWNNSDNLNNNFSYEEIDDNSYVLRSDRYCGLRNLYSSSEVIKDNMYLKNTMEQPIPKSSKLEINYDPVIKDEEYRAWLKRNNILNYTHFCNSNSSEISHLTDHKELRVNYSGITSEIPFRYSSQFSLENGDHQSQSEYYRDGKFMDIQCYNIYEMIIYEHLVVINFLTFFTSYFSVRRIRRLTVNDHIIQIIFFAICYGVFTIVKNSGIAMLIN